MKFRLLLTALFAIVFTACTGATGATGTDGTDGKSVNSDSLSAALREEITNKLWDSLQSEAVLDSVYDTLFFGAFTDAWMDSAREALKDSLLSASYDSLYDALYDSVYDDIYAKSVIRDLYAQVYSKKEDLYAAFANQYPLMYKNFEYPVPLSVAVRNSGKIWHNILVQAWIPGYSDTGSVTTFVNPDSTKLYGPALNLYPENYLGLTAATPVQVQVRAYALENDHQILFFAESYAVNIHPVQIFGAEYEGIDMDPWNAVWVTPNMDSISGILSQLAKAMPDGYGGYQLFGHSTIEASVDSQVMAVYNILAAKQITYVNNTKAGSIGQKIKYPQEVLREKQANCIEGAFLFASVLEAIGIHPVIVSVEGHAFLGWRSTDKGTTYTFLETTMAWGKMPSTYTAAVTKGIEEYNDEVTAGNFESGASVIIDIQDARTAGIRPNDVP
ncbi:MAG: hypothetical protein M0P13_07625 [Fibrobacteraceae bacterium]|nr:hypothetical protein [Fibrobacteraceae bacterium]